MPSISSSRAPGMAFAVARPPDGRTRRSDLPWITSVGALIPRSSRGAVARRQDRGDLARGSARVARAVEARRGQLAQLLARPLEPGRADRADSRSMCVEIGGALARRRRSRKG